jgi:hypothetical protein
MGGHHFAGGFLSGFGGGAHGQTLINSSSKFSLEPRKWF